MTHVSCPTFLPIAPPLTHVVQPGQIPWFDGLDHGVDTVGSWCGGQTVRIEMSSDPDDEEEDLGDEEDLGVAQPAADDESSFDDFDDDFDDDFEEEENDPDWDHPDDGDAEPPPSGKSPGRKK